MRAVVVREFGGPEGLEVVDVPDPAPGPGQVLVEVGAAGVAGVDAVIRRGTLGGYGFRAGFVPGAEVAGTVRDLGDGVDPSWRGRSVWAFLRLTGGGYAERVAVDVADVLELPAGLSPVDSVTLGSAGPVAHFALAHGRFRAGESVLVRGAAGSIGIAAVELAAAGGAGAVAVTTSSPGRGQRLREFGATHVLDRSGAGPGAGPDAGFDVVVDVVGGPDVPRFLDRLRPNGRYVTVGAVAGMPPADFGARLLANFRRSPTFSTFSLDTVPHPDVTAVRAEQFAAAVRGELHTVVHDVLPLGRAADAHRAMDAGEVFGRVVLTP
ncbi:zinc-binding dehydrogenase [Kineococcus rhizosphaerae]|uniref:NADPH:quinone reductase-like Zn-dependent oxidoreductase n=1 Tax=Kineococcus rhizosphaerae TaxID=559628 RepID=A0A2T0R1W0_9ACTN|nr:zinc-binding dehydrogenase [Kineococcus rhizosphaerae]PRY13548.1 NADPH:quinone reductase-like Zn-dependent oxidoreductase [Kineococcus rhizosphaerae]